MKRSISKIQNYRKLNLGGYGYNTPSSQDENYVKEERAKLSSMDNFGNVAGGVGAAFNPVVGGLIKGVTAGSSALLKDTVDDKGFKKEGSTFKTGLAYTLTPTANWIQNIDRGKNWDKLSNEGKFSSIASIAMPWLGSIADKELSDKAKQEYEAKVGQYYKDSFRDFSQSKINSGEVNLQGNAGARMFKFGGTIGGSIKKLSSNSSEVEGKKHEQGGVKLPKEGIELEDGETISKIKGKDFVFSDNLGFAEEHKKIAKTIGRLEKQPDTPQKQFSLQRLKLAEQKLAKEQEVTKNELGIENDSDVMKNGGIFKKYEWGGRRRGIEEKSLKDTRALKTSEDPKFVDAGYDIKLKDKFSFKRAGNSLVEATPNLVDTISGFSNAQRRLNTPVEQMGEIPQVTFKTLSADASLNEADRQRVGLNKWISQNTSDSNVARANMASALASTISAKNAIQQEVNNKNVDIKNQQMLANQEIREKNIANAFANKRLRRLALDEAYQDLHDNTLNASRGFSQSIKDNKQTKANQDQAVIDAYSRMTPEQMEYVQQNLPRMRRLMGYEKGGFIKMGNGGSVEEKKDNVYKQKNYDIILDEKDIVGYEGKYPKYGGESGKRKAMLHQQALKEGIHTYTINNKQELPYKANEYNKTAAKQPAMLAKKWNELDIEDIQPLKEEEINIKAAEVPSKDRKFINVEEQEEIKKKRAKAHNSRVYSSGEGFYFIDKNTGRKVSSKSKLGIGIKRLFS